MRKAGLDIGRNAPKIFMEGGLKDTFPSFVGTYRPLRLERRLTADDMIVEYNTSSYYVGAIAKDEAHDGAQSFIANKANFDTKLLGLVALHRLLRDGDEVAIVTGHPVENHVEPEKERMRQLFLGRHELTVNGVCKRFFVSSATVTAEGAAAMYLLPERPMAAHGIDAGSATTNFVTWKRGAWVDKLSGTLPFGFENIQNLQLGQYARMAAYEITRRLRTFIGPVYVMGGRAEELAEALKGYLPVQVFALEDGVYANAKVYYALGVKLSEKVSAKQ